MVEKEGKIQGEEQMQGNDDLGTNTTGLPGVGRVKLTYAARK